jgi:hypothetical protein
MDRCFPPEEDGPPCWTAGPAMCRLRTVALWCALAPGCAHYSEAVLTLDRIERWSRHALPARGFPMCFSARRGSALPRCSRDQPTHHMSTGPLRHRCEEPGSSLSTQRRTRTREGGRTRDGSGFTADTLVSCRVAPQKPTRSCKPARSAITNADDPRAKAEVVWPAPRRKTNPAVKTRPIAGPASHHRQA